MLDILRVLSTSGCVMVYDRWFDTCIILKFGKYGAERDEST